MKTLTGFFVFVVFFTVVLSAAVEARWNIDFGQAVERADKEKRLLLVNFTGSDWCGWCHRLRDEVFVQAPFIAYANEELVLVELDFPRSKPLSPVWTKQNQELAERYQVSSYPTVLILDAKGRVLARLGYMQGGAKTFVRELRRIKARQGGPEEARAVPGPQSVP